MIELFLKLFSISHFISIAATQIICGILFLMLIMEVKKGNIKFQWDFIVVLFTLYFLWVDLSIIANFDKFPNFIKFLKSLVKWWHLLIFFLVFYLCNFLKIKFKNIFQFILIGATISSCLVLFQSIFENSFGRGFYSHALTFSNNIAIVLVVLYALIIFKKEKLANFFYFAGILNLAGLFFSLERGPLLYFIITILFINFFAFKKKGVIINLLIITIFVSSVFIYKPFKVRFAQLTDYKKIMKTENGISTRIFLWQASLKIIKEKPFFGVGRKLKKALEKKLKVEVTAKSHSHNSYLSIACYHGIPALIFLMLLFVYLINVFWKSSNLFVKIGGTSTILIFLLEGLTEYNFGDAEVAMFFWFLMGIFYYLNNKNQC